MNNIEYCLLLLCIGILGIWSGRKAKDKYFKGPYFVVGITAIIVVILFLFKSTSSSITKDHQSSRDSVIERNTIPIRAYIDSEVKERAKIRFVPASDLPIQKNK